VLGDPGAAAWNREVLHADAVTPDAVVAAGLALPLFGGRRLCLVRGMVESGARGLDRLRAAIEAARKQPGGWPSEGVTVALVASGADRKSPVLRLLPEAEQVEARPPSGRGIAGWLQGRARAARLTLAPAAADALVALVGEDLGRLAGELEKAALFVGPDGRVTEEVVLALVGESRARRYWELGQALEEGEAGKALRVLEQLLAAGEEPTPLLGLVVAFVRDAWRVKSAVAEGRDPRAALRGRPSFVVDRIATRAAAIRPEALAGALRRCFDVEVALKSGGGEPRALLTALVADVARA
jgi:DNA polymerase III subunit delta